jgi:hypothetical protein
MLRTIRGLRVCRSVNSAFVGCVSAGDVPSQRLDQCVFVALHLEDFDCLVRRACCQPPAIVVEDGIVLHLVSFNQEQVDVLSAVGHCVLGAGCHEGWSRDVCVPDAEGFGCIGRRTIMSSWLEVCETFAWNVETTS